MEAGTRTLAESEGWDPPSAVPRPKPAPTGNVPTAPLPSTETNCDPRRAPMLAATSPAVHSSGRQTSARPRLSIEESLPGDVLEAVLGFLDRETLCTARLVSKTFCAAASARICSLILPSISQAVSRRRFPCLRNVTVSHDGKQESVPRVDPSLQGLSTTLVIEDLGPSLRETLSQLARMTKLRELQLQELGLQCWEHNAAQLRECTDLEIISVLPRECSLSVATTIATLTSLTELHIAVYWPDLVSDYSWLEATALRNLQALNIYTSYEALALLGNLTGLTRLFWIRDEEGSAMSVEVPLDLAPLTRLTKLKVLHLDECLSESNVEIACSLGLGSLVSLDLSAWYDCEFQCGQFLTRQTALTQLALGGPLGDLRHIGPLRMDLLQDLRVRNRHCAGMDAVGLSAQGNASSLTALEISIGMGFEPVEVPVLALSQALSGLTRLRHLELSRGDAERTAKFLDYALALRALTSLTCLQISSGHLDNGDLRAVLLLTRLRVLELCSSCLTDDVVPELAILTNLQRLRLAHCGVTSLAPVTNVVNALRHAKGWAPMEAHIWPEHPLKPQE